MKALLLFTLALTMMAGYVMPATGSPEPQSSSPGTGSGSSSAEAIYARRCASCHGKDGKADTVRGKMISTRNLTDPKWQAEVSDERIFNSITNGRGRMPGFGKRVSEADIDSLVLYVRRFKK